MSDERGEVSLIQLLVAMSLFIVILIATLDVFDTSVRLNREANQRLEQQDQARRTSDALARQLRNLASPTTDVPAAIDRAQPSDLIFQTVDPNGPNAGANSSNVMRVRYCLRTSDATLHRQQQTWTTATPPAAPTPAACPAPEGSSQWDTGKSAVLAEDVVNDSSQPIFSFNSAITTEVSSVHVELRIDDDSTKAPAQVAISSGVFLRNQNRKPVAVFTADTTVPGKIVLNGGGSSDPEGDQLTYAWYDNGIAIPNGTGVRFDYTVTSGSTHVLKLKVKDPANLEDESDIETVVAP